MPATASVPYFTTNIQILAVLGWDFFGQSSRKAMESALVLESALSAGLAASACDGLLQRTDGHLAVLHVGSHYDSVEHRNHSWTVRHFSYWLLDTPLILLRIS